MGNNLKNLELLFEKDSEYQNIKLFVEDKKKIILALDTYLQFVEGEDEQNYHYALTQHAFDMNPDAKTALILGGGDFLVARNLVKLNSKFEITLVELDEEVVKLCKTHPRIIALNQKSFEYCNVIIEDALEWVPSCRFKFDIIILDFPDDTKKELGKLYEESFYKEITNLLNKNGVISIQCHESVAVNVDKKIKSILNNSKRIKYKMPFLGGGEIIVGKKEQE